MKVEAIEITNAIYFASRIMHKEAIGDLVSYHRKRAGLTQVELARHAGLGRTAVQDLEAGKGRISWKHLETILGVLNIELKPTGPLVDEWLNERNQNDA